MSNSSIAESFAWLSAIEPERPRHVWENREDAMYHEMAMPAPHDTAPEFFAFTGNRVWVFNRALRWHRASGLILCHEVGARLALTGEKQVSRWWTAAPNELRDAGDWTHFAKRSARSRDAAVLPCFQSCLAQHPDFTLEVQAEGVTWQCVISVKGRGGPPLLASAWTEGAGAHHFALREALRARGYTGQFPEIHIAIGVWHPDPQRAADLKFRLTSETQPALLASLPVIRRLAAGPAVPVACLALDAAGQPIADPLQVMARVGDRKVALAQGAAGIWSGVLEGLNVGAHALEFSSHESGLPPAHSTVRLTEGRFARYDAARHLVELPGEPPLPLSGSYQGTFYLRDAGSSEERLVEGQADWNAWDRLQGVGEHQVFWDGMYPTELDQRFAYLARQGWDVLHLHQHWGIWGRLDAGGRISPHGAEQLALYLETAQRHGLRHMQALTSYEYSVRRTGRTYGGTAPWSAYVEAGFDDADWFHPYNTPFDRLFANYLADFAQLFHDDDALLSISSCGEGDAHCGTDRPLDIHRRLHPQCPDILYVAEPVHCLDKLPRDYAHELGKWPQAMFGCRNYCQGRDGLTEVEFAVNYRLMTLGRLYLAEGNYAASPQYVRLKHFLAGRSNGLESWTGTEFYRRALRDSLYLGLIHRIPLVVFWDEAVCEDEHRVYAAGRRAFDWTQPEVPADVVLRVRNENVVEGGDRLLLLRYEQALARLGLQWRYAYEDEALPASILVIDPREGYVEPQWVSDGGRIPDALRATRPLTPPAGYFTQTLRGSDGRSTLTYLANTSFHEYLHTYYFMDDLSGRHHRNPRPVSCVWRWGKLAPEARYEVWDLDAKQCIRTGTVGESREITLPPSRSDYLVISR